MFQQVGKLLMIAGLVVAALGGLLWVLGRLGWVRLPGDLVFGGKSWRLYLPIGTCILLSILLTLILWVVQRLRQ
jgi:hypothetical protein